MTLESLSGNLSVTYYTADKSKPSEKAGRKATGPWRDSRAAEAGHDANANPHLLYLGGGFILGGSDVCVLSPA